MLYIKYKNLVSHCHNGEVYHEKRKLSDIDQSVVTAVRGESTIERTIKENSPILQQLFEYRLYLVW